MVPTVPDQPAPLSPPSGLVALTVLTVLYRQPHGTQATVSAIKELYPKANNDAIHRLHRNGWLTHGRTPPPWRYQLTADAIATIAGHLGDPAAAAALPLWVACSRLRIGLRTPFRRPPRR